MLLRRSAFWIVGLLVFWCGSLRAAEDQFFDSHGVKIRYQVEGQGAPVLLIHGYTANIENQWGAPGVINGLKDHFQVIAFDNRGHGKSDKPHEVEKYGEEMVRDAIRLLDHLKIKKANVVGYSMGGFLTNKLLTMYPDRLITATLGGAGWSGADKTMPDFLEELATALETKGDISALFIRLTPAGRPQPTPEQLKTTNDLLTSHNDVKALAACARGMKGLTVTEEQLRANRVPTLALIGEVDPLKTGVDALGGVMTNLKTVVIPAADHMTAFSNPKFTGTLLVFLSSGGKNTELKIGESILGN